MDELLATPRAALIELKRLPPPAVGAMVSEMLSLSEPPAEFVQFLVAHSEGNPFFIAEYLRAAVAGNYLVRDDAGGWQIDSRVSFASLLLPRSLRELVARRLEGLPPAARRLCEAASVLGRAFDGDLPRLVAGRRRVLARAAPGSRRRAAPSRPLAARHGQGAVRARRPAGRRGAHPRGAGAARPRAALVAARLGAAPDRAGGAASGPPAAP